MSGSDIPAAEQILLRCSKGCGKELMVDRHPTDYPEAVRVETVCNECWQGDFAEVFHFDSEGRHITRDPDDYHGRADGPYCTHGIEGDCQDCNDEDAEERIL